MCSVRVPPGPGLRTNVLECMSLQGLFLENRDILTSYTVGYTLTKIINATLLFLPPIFHELNSKM